MNEYISMWLDIIENMNNDNTYKLAWGRSILEIVCEMNDIEERNCIHFEMIAEKMLKYYWNQVFFFNLKQGPGKVPVVVQVTEKCIDYYKNLTQSNIPVWFEYAEVELKKDVEFYNAAIRKITNTLPENVSWRFMKSKKEVLPIYELDNANKCLYLTKEEVMSLKEYAFVLSQLLNYKWAQLLEKFNSAPRIASKVKGISEAKVENRIRRSNLRKFRDVLLTQYEDSNIIDFYTGDILKEEDIEVDHVIPWSFMYSDDIWNLVLTSKSFNASKSNHIPTVYMIEKLKKRNQELLGTIKNEKYRSELRDAIEHDYVNKFYMALKL